LWPPGTLLGLETPHFSLLLVVLLVSGGVALAALGEFEFHLLGFGLVLTSAALAGLRSCMLQRLLHGRNTSELLAWRQSVHPVQLIYALAPWTTFTALVLALFMEGEELSEGVLLEWPHLSSLMLRLLGARGQSSRRPSAMAPPPWPLRRGPSAVAPPPWPLPRAPLAGPSGGRLAAGRLLISARHELPDLLHGPHGDVGGGQDVRTHVERRRHTQGGARLALGQQISGQQISEQ